MTPRAERRLRNWANSLGFTVALCGLTAWGVGAEVWLMSVAVIVAAALGLGLFYYLFPRGLHFAFGTGTGLALYASLFVVLGKAQFPDAPDWSRVVAFLLPVVFFLAAVWWRREALHHITRRQEASNLDHIAQTARWLLFAMAIGVVCFVLPANRLGTGGQAFALLAAMTAIGVMVAHAVQDVMRLLVDVALITDEIAGRLQTIAVPAIAFLMMYSLLVIGFASAYRVADALSIEALFHDADGPTRLRYSDALHFSVATISTVGYGDIRPQDDGIRVLASLEVVAGQLLLLFGVAEILRSRRVRSVAEAAENADDGADDAVEAGHEGAPEPQQFRRNPASSSRSRE